MRYQFKFTFLRHHKISRARSWLARSWNTEAEQFIIHPLKFSCEVVTSIIFPGLLLLFYRDCGTVPLLQTHRIVNPRGGNWCSLLIYPHNQWKLQLFYFIRRRNPQLRSPFLERAVHKNVACLPASLPSPHASSVIQTNKATDGQ
jgi:hypothetical protein